MSRLFVYPARGEASCFPLEKGKATIGRLPDNDIPIDDPFSSGHHAVISASEIGFRVRDNASKNGTFLNGQRIQGEMALKKGDEILIGTTRIIFDREISTNVEVTAQVSPRSNINTVIHLKEILKKPDVETTLKSLAMPRGVEKFRTEYKLLSAVNEMSKALVLHKSMDELLDQVMNLISENLPMDRGVLMLREGNPLQLIPKVIRINNRRLANQRIAVSQSIVNVALDQHSSVLTYDAQADPRFKAKESVIKSNIHSAMCVPLWNNKDIIGVIYSDRISILDQFTEDDLKLLTLLANLAAVKIENARLVEQSIEKEKMEKELALASQIQNDFLPKEQPVCKNFEIAGTHIPCHQVGGDYYDFISIAPDRLGIIVADVSGKGVGASLLMASLRAALHSEIHPRYRIRDLAAKLNDFVHRSSASNRFITFFFSELNTKTGDLTYVNAGHSPPLILQKTGEVCRLESCGLCLGMFPSVAYDARKVSLKAGDVAVFFTDGITESRNRKNEEFSEEKLVGLIRKHLKLPVPQIIAKIRDEFSSFTAGGDQLDDMTLVVVRSLVEEPSSKTSPRKKN